MIRPRIKRLKNRKIRKEKVSTMKKKLRKAIAVLVIAANMVGLCAPAYAEEAPTRAEEAYTVTEDEQGMVTIEFNEPIVLSLEESYAEDGAEEDDGIVPYGDVALDYIPEKYWGTYTSTIGTYTMIIEGGKQVLFDGYWNGNKVYCHDSLTAIHFTPNRKMTGGFGLNYSNYYIKTDAGYSYVNNPIDIDGYYDPDYKGFVIARIVYRP